VMYLVVDNSDKVGAHSTGNVTVEVTWEVEMTALDFAFIIMPAIIGLVCATIYTFAWMDKRKKARIPADYSTRRAIGNPPHHTNASHMAPSTSGRAKTEFQSAPRPRSNLYDSKPYDLRYKTAESGPPKMSIIDQDCPTCGNRMKIDLGTNAPYCPSCDN